MRNPGVVTLAALTVTTALSSVAQAAITGRDGVSACGLMCEFTYGSGGTSCNVIVQTSLDGGTTWFDIARFDFTTSSAKKYANLQTIAAKAITAYAALSSEGLNDGLLGPRFRAVVTSVGTYAASTTLALRAHLH